MSRLIYGHLRPLLINLNQNRYTSPLLLSNGKIKISKLGIFIRFLAISMEILFLTVNSLLLFRSCTRFQGYHNVF